MSVKTSHEMQASLVASDDRFEIAAYVGKHGWVELDLTGRVDWGEVEALVRESYRLVAPAKLAQVPPEARHPETQVLPGKPGHASQKVDQGPAAGAGPAGPAPAPAVGPRRRRVPAAARRPAWARAAA